MEGCLFGLSLIMKVRSTKVDPLCQLCLIWLYHVSEMTAPPKKACPQHQIFRFLTMIEPYHRSHKGATYGMDIESFLIPSKPANVVGGVYWG